MRTITHASSSRPGVEYTTTIHEDGAVLCTCPGFVYRQKCKHVTSAKAGRVDAPVKANTPPVYSPMLARALPAGKSIQDYAEPEGTWRGRVPRPEWMLEEKHDGHRLILIIDDDSISAHSRGGKPRALPKHIIRSCKRLPNGVYDGELLVPGGTSTDVKAIENIDKLELQLFDILKTNDTDVMSKPGFERRALLEKAGSLLADNSSVKVTKQYSVSEDTLNLIWNAGGEGAIIKNVNTQYVEGQRTKGWIKFKKLAAAELTVTGFESGKNGPHSTICLKDDFGKECKVKTRNSCWLKLFADDSEKYIGTRLVISYQEKTRDGKYRHPMADHFAG